VGIDILYKLYYNFISLALPADYYSMASQQDNPVM